MDSGIVALLAVVVVIGYLIYRRIKNGPEGYDDGSETVRDHWDRD